MVSGRKTNLTIDFIKEEFKKRNYILLEETYVNNSTKLKYKCLKHPEEVLYMAYSNFQQGCKCPHCALEIRGMKRRLTIDFIRSEFEKRGYKLLESEYKGSTQKLRYFCPNHPDKKLTISWSNFNQGRGCTFCNYSKIVYREKLTYEEVKQEFEKRNYTLISPEYQNAKIKLLYKCPFHPEQEQSILISNLKNGEGCLYCAKEQFGKNQLGENNPSWKGGVSALNLFLRNSTKQWKKQVLKKYKYKCFVTGENSKELEIHHTIPFYMMRDDVLNSLNLPIYKTVEEYTQEQLELIVSSFNELHKNLEGVPLKKEIHILFHSIYGKGYTSFEELLEFKENYLNYI